MTRSPTRTNTSTRTPTDSPTTSPTRSYTPTLSPSPTQSPTATRTYTPLPTPTNTPVCLAIGAPVNYFSSSPMLKFAYFKPFTLTYTASVSNVFFKVASGSGFAKAAIYLASAPAVNIQASSSMAAVPGWVQLPMLTRRPLAPGNYLMAVTGNGTLYIANSITSGDRSVATTNYLLPYSCSPTVVSKTFSMYANVCP